MRVRSHSLASSAAGVRAGGGGRGGGGCECGIGGGRVEGRWGVGRLAQCSKLLRGWRQLGTEQSRGRLAALRERHRDHVGRRVGRASGRGPSPRPPSLGLGRPQTRPFMLSALYCLSTCGQGEGGGGGASSPSAVRGSMPRGLDSRRLRVPSPTQVSPPRLPAVHAGGHAGFGLLPSPAAGRCSRTCCSRRGCGWGRPHRTCTHPGARVTGSATPASAAHASAAAHASPRPSTLPSLPLAAPAPVPHFSSALPLAWLSSIPYRTALMAVYSTRRCLSYVMPCVGARQAGRRDVSLLSWAGRQARGAGALHCHPTGFGQP